MGEWHRLSKTRLYSIWKSMKTRCYNEKSRSYRWYGAKGVKVCTDWLNFLPFYEWAVTHGYEEGLTLDRIRYDESYSPANCRWITAKEQQRNRSDNHLITINGETKCLSEWSETSGVNYGTALSRHKSGMSWAKALEVTD